VDEGFNKDRNRYTTILDETLGIISNNIPTYNDNIQIGVEKLTETLLFHPGWYVRMVPVIC
jgi:hypothetical protein